MTNEEAKKAFTDQVKVVHKHHSSRSLIVYDRIKRFGYDITDGKLTVIIVLIGSPSNSLTYALPQDIAVYDENKPLTHESYFK